MEVRKMKSLAIINKDMVTTAQSELNIYLDMTNWNKQLKADLAKNSKGFEALAKYARNWKV
jgi:hypothetical protein